MRWVTAYHRELQVVDKPAHYRPKQAQGFNESITAHAIHELVFDPRLGEPAPLIPALQAIWSSSGGRLGSDSTPEASRALIWIDSGGLLYPPAVSVGGLCQPFYVLRPRSADLIWSATECLRSCSVGAVVALLMDPPTRLDVRRLQLAVEKGGGIGLLLRPNLPSAAPHIYAAATRWRVQAVPGERTIQRWHLQLIHGHGRLLGQAFVLEKHRGTGKTHFMPVSASLVDHPIQATAF